MVTAAVPAVLLAVLAAGGDADAAVRGALARGDYPWYDARTDAVRPVKPAAEPEGKPSGSAGGAGSTIATAVMVLALSAGVGLLAWSWARRRRVPVEAAGRAAGAGAIHRVLDLPSELPAVTDDPLAEARRRRDRGDLAGAIILLFAHQLLRLDRLGRLRPAPGRTARQLVRDLTDPEVRRLVAPTLRLFEAAYYGRHAPAPAAFAAAWAAAEELERRLAAGGAP